MYRTLYDAKIASIGYTTSTVVKEIRVPSRGMRQMGVLTEKERASDDKTHKSGRTITKRT